MGRYSVGVQTGAGTISLPQISLYASGTVGGKIREVGLTNTTSSPTQERLVRLTTAGTKGAALTASKHDSETVAPSCSAFNTHTVAPTISEDLGYRAQLGAAIGAGVIWTFGDTGVRVPVGATVAVAVCPDISAGMILQAYIVWDE